MKLFLNEIVNRIKANKITICIFIFIFILWIIFVGLLLNKIIKEEYNGEHEYSYNTLTQGSGRTPIIKKDEKISQKFFPNNNNLFKIGIFALTPTGNSESNVNVIIKECKTNK